MRPQRVLGPSLTFVVVSGVIIAGATAGVLIERGPTSVAFAVVLAPVVWRLLGVSVGIGDGKLVVRNVLKTYRLPINDVDIRARVVDPRREQYAAGSIDGYPEIPTASDDNTVNRAKWYTLEHGEDRYQIDALMGRSPSNHERAAFTLRQQILTARTEDQAD